MLSSSHVLQRKTKVTYQIKGSLGYTDLITRKAYLTAPKSEHDNQLISKINAWHRVVIFTVNSTFLNGPTNCTMGPHIVCPKTNRQEPNHIIFCETCANSASLGHIIQKYRLCDEHGVFFGVNVFK